MAHSYVETGNDKLLKKTIIIFGIRLFTGCIIMESLRMLRRPTAIEVQSSNKSTFRSLLSMETWTN